MKTTQESHLITIAIVEDHQVLAEALEMALGEKTDMQVIGIAGTLAEARELLAKQCPNIVVLDINLPDGDGLDFMPEIRRACPAAYVLVLTSLSEESVLMRAVNAGVNGFIGKNRSLAEVEKAIRKAADGEIVMPSSLLMGLLTHASQDAPASQEAITEPLTAREQEMLMNLARGKSTRDIANELFIAPMTVRTHIRNLMGKLGTRSRLETVMVAIRHGWIQPPL